MNLPRLNFPQYSFRMTEREGKLFIWDDLRRCWLRCTPEEWVRRHAVRWIGSQEGAAPALIVQEHAVKVCGMDQRADAVLFGADGRPLLLAECKAPGVDIDSAVLDQAVRYNHILGARYIMLTNGMHHYFFEHETGGGYSRLESPPELSL